MTTSAKAKAGRDLNYLISQQVLSLPPSKAQQRQIQIVEAAIEVFAEVGIEKATYDRIAKACGVTRPLIQHYFPEKRSLFTLVVKYIRGHFQEVAVRAMGRGHSEEEMLRNYVLSTFQWREEFPSHVKVWMLFYYLASHDAHFRKLNSELVNMGHDRIQALLEQGNAKRAFRSRNPALDAKLIQSAITGALVSITTEDFRLNGKDFARNVCEQCLAIAKLR